MSALTEDGLLPIGIEVAGAVHQAFTIRPRLVRDSVDVLTDPLAQDNDAYRGVALFARQLVSLGTLQAGDITTELLLGMYDTDLGAIMAAHGRLEARLQTFRGGSQVAAAGASGAGEDRGAVAAGA
jgi:phage FluMu protein gp41